jgi:hypothetical protein
VYEFPSADCLSSDEEITQTIRALVKYGYSLQNFAGIGMPLYNMILGRSHTSPLDMYAICANYQLNDLFAPIAPHVLSYDLLAMTEEQAERIGPINLRKLISLYIERMNELKALLSSPILLNHDPSSDCEIREQDFLKGAWSLGTKALAWDSRPGKLQTLRFSIT